MSDTEISVSEAARKFADCVNRVYYQNETFVLLKNGVPVARLVPVVEPVCRGHDLGAGLARFELSPAEARAWQRDLKAARKSLKPPRDAWEQESSSIPKSPETRRRPGGGRRIRDA